MSYILERFGSGMHYIRIPAEEGEALLARFPGGRMRAVLPGGIAFSCALMPKAEGGFYVNLGKRVRGQAGLQEGSLVEIVFEADSSEHQFDVPPEFDAVLESDPAAAAAFAALSPGRRRSILYLVQQLRTPDSRIQRSLRIAQRLAAGITDPRRL